MKLFFLNEYLAKLRSLEIIFFPSFCRLCSALLESPTDRQVCNACWKSVKPARASFCISCGRFFEGDVDPHLCGSCLREKPLYSRHRSCGRYWGKLKEIILLCKFHNLPILAEGLAKFAIDSLAHEDSLWWGLDAVVPVPLHPKRQRERGYNHAQIIAKYVADSRGVQLLDKHLVKVKNVPPQMSLAMEDRVKSVKGAFAVKKPEEIRGKVVLLLDDVFTTGSTAGECSRLLVEAGAQEVRALTIAQA
ncbi:MAG: ComF family protein [Candidatus Aminicenantes bacterium]